MQKSRLDGLADGIFAIVMTLLALDLKIPELSGVVTNEMIWREIQHMAPLFLSYILSFLVLASYWIGHHFIVSVFATNLTRKLMHLNIPFLLMVALVPFSTHLLGNYPQNELAIFVYAVNVVIISFFLFLLLRHVDLSREIKNPRDAKRIIRRGYIRIIIPPITAVVAVIVSFWNPTYSIYIFVLTMFFNIIPGALTLIEEGVICLTQE
ncbi:MAG: hypothetical protein COU90_01070 [Candidatus Ryanbacteria bacterium CG10_big_fil_rev_8_21_14_0_10_43_42]|uniref:DUF1211 domain-containing protein n=1 Tax=Candidatus Ryanbacteria bacterium CG10_big_fil_rev_8_21_14_0_10_43_42 TaxID=1974864 RepID=A0A2M8KY33_9BACT|nr:MAG: hypothetical protein COU90_01070 [Candidatus Ryanbacteria bacterium CG10_big_fil_rev_8_21_14_0_10_43_42]